jgi:hypothetical protein
MQRTFYVIRIAGTDKYIQPLHEGNRLAVRDDFTYMAVCDTGYTACWYNALKFSSDELANYWLPALEDINGGFLNLQRNEVEIVKITVNMEVV